MTMRRSRRSIGWLLFTLAGAAACRGGTPQHRIEKIRFSDSSSLASLLAHTDTYDRRFEMSRVQFVHAPFGRDVSVRVVGERGRAHLHDLGTSIEPDPESGATRDVAARKDVDNVGGSHAHGRSIELD